MRGVLTMLLMNSEGVFECSSVFFFFAPASCAALEALASPSA